MASKSGLREKRTRLLLYLEVSPLPSQGLGLARALSVVYLISEWKLQDETYCIFADNFSIMGIEVKLKTQNHIQNLHRFYIYCATHIM